MILDTLPQLRKLSADDQLTLAGELFREALTTPENAEPDPDIVERLRRSLEDYERDPSTAVSWAELRRKISKSA